MRFDLSDDEWALLEPMMAKGARALVLRSIHHERDILRAAHRHAVARSARALSTLSIF